MSENAQTENQTVDKILIQKKKDQSNVEDSSQIVNVNDKMVKLVIFALADQWYAFYGQSINEILPKNTLIFFVPGCPESLTGVINVRGEIESVINISLVLKLSDRQQRKIQSIVLLAKSPAMSSGILVDKVIDVVDVPERIIQSPPETLPDHLRAYVLDVLEFRGQAVTVLNLDKIFKDYQQNLEA